jgi:hypothetical protein
MMLKWAKIPVSPQIYNLFWKTAQQEEVAPVFSHTIELAYVAMETKSNVGS